MVEDDTIRLLRECNAGIKMGVSSLDDVMKYVQSDGLKEILSKSKETHTKLGNTTHTYLKEYHDEGKEPAMMAKVMSKMKANMKLDEDGPDNEIASMITDGCNMGVKSIYKYMNQYPAANDKVKHLAKDVADAEETLAKELRQYL